ncbi:MAG: PAS domain S-box protein [Cyanobacteria bacterium P01_C01_bin.120]
MVGSTVFSNFSADPSVPHPYNQWPLWSSQHVGLFVVERSPEQSPEPADFQIVAANLTMMQSGIFLSDLPVGQVLETILSPDQADEQRRCYRQCLDGQTTPLTVTAQTGDRTRADSSVRWWQLTPSVDTTTTTSPPRLVVVAIDVSQQQQALHHSQSEQRTLRQILDQMPSQVVWKDRHSVFGGCNRSFLAMTGLASTAAIVGKTDYDMPWKREESDWFIACDQRIMAADAPEMGIVEPIQQATGTQAWLSTSKIPLHDANGQVSGILLVIEDITEKRQVEMALRQQEAEYRDIFEHAVDGFMINDLETGQPVAVNPALCEIYGYTAEAFLQLAPEQFVHASLLDKFAEFLVTVRSGGTFTAEAVGIHQDGTLIDLEVNAKAIDYQGQPHALSILRDISDRKQAEAALAQSEQKLRSIFNGVHEAIIIHDLDGNILDVNDRMLELHQVSREEALRMTIQDSFSSSETSFDNLGTQFQRVMAGETVRFEWIAVRPHSQEVFDVEVILRKTGFDGEDRIIASVRDISDLKAAEAEKRAVQARFQTFLKHSPAVIYIKDAQGRMQLMSDEYGRTFGIEPSTIMGKTIAEIVPPDQAEDIIQNDLRVMASCQTIQCEETISLADGAHTFLSVKFPIEDEQGSVVGLGGISTDITEYKQTEAALLESEKRFRRLPNNIPGLIYQFKLAPDGSYSFPFVSSACIDFFGYTPEEMYQDIQLLFNAVHPEDVAAFNHSIELSAATMNQCLWEGRMVSTAGQLRWVRGLSRPERQADGGILWEGLLIDVSDRKVAEMKLQDYAEQQALLNQLTNQIRESLDVDVVLQTAIQALHSQLHLGWCAFAWYDPSTEPSTWSVICDISSDGKRYTGEYSAEVIGPIDQPLMADGILCINDVDSYPEPIHRAFLQASGTQARLMKTIRTQWAQVGILICDRQDGPHWWQSQEIELVQVVADQVAIAMDQGQLYACSCRQAEQLSQTLAQLRTAQAQMIQTEKMSSLGQMVAGVAHEINNPINFIHANVRPALEYASDLLTLVDLYQQRYPDPPESIAEKIEDIDLDFLRADFIQLLQSMQTGTQRIREIILSLRNFSRLDEADFKTVNLHDGIESTLVVLAHELKRGRQEPVQVIRQYGELPAVECYPSQLNQVLMNLLANAIEAMADSDDAEITITTTVENDWAVMTIGDNGPGISKPIQAQIFDPFFTTKPVGQGTGMGLSISYQIVAEKHGGELVVQSEPGQGTQFTVKIPLRQAP